ALSTLSYLDAFPTRRSSDLSVNYVGRTSMEVGVKVESEDLMTGLREKTASAYTTFVALDERGKPAPVPPLVLEGAEQERRFREGDRKSTRLNSSHVKISYAV